MADTKESKTDDVQGAEEALDAKTLKIEKERLASHARDLEERIAALQELNKPKPKGPAGKGTPIALVHVVGKGRRDVRPGEELLEEELKGLNCKREYTADERNSPTFHVARPTFHYEMR